MLKDCIVTAVELVENYQPDGQDTKLTRNFIPEHYFTGIKSLLNLDKELLIYCNKSVEEDITNALKDKVQSLPTFINKTSHYENCETSSRARALSNLGIGVEESCASAEEVANAMIQQSEIDTIKNLKPSIYKFVKLYLFPL